MTVNKCMRMTFAVAMTASVAMVANAQEQQAATKKPAEVTKTAAEKKTIPLAEARAKIDAVISEPNMMTEVMKQLSAEDQKTFLADVNAAISKLPESVEEKTAKYLNVNRAALKGADSGNMANILAVTFATVPPASLTVISERYGNDLFNKKGDPTKTVSDASFEKIATEVVGKVELETSGSDDANVRNTLAILMFLRASNGQEGLTEKLTDTIPNIEAREAAKRDWIPAAMAEGENKSYEGMLAYADAESVPNIEIVLSLAGPQIQEAMVVDIASGMDNFIGYQTAPVLDQAFGGYDDARVTTMDNDPNGVNAAATGGGEVPRSPADVPWNPAYKPGDSNLPPAPTPSPEPSPYPWGDMGA